MKARRMRHRVPLQLRLPVDSMCSDGMSVKRKLFGLAKLASSL